MVYLYNNFGAQKGLMQKQHFFRKKNYLTQKNLKKCQN